MNYRRVIPRDLFNEAKLLKCLGQLTLLHHDGKDYNKLRIIHHNDQKGFVINQDPNSGDLYVENLSVYLRTTSPSTPKSIKILLHSPYNSKEPYPLLFQIKNSDQLPVFNNEGQFSQYFLNLLQNP